MTRTEEIIAYANSFKGKDVENEELKETIRLAIIDGALWADEHPNIDAIVDKACQFLRDNIDQKLVIYHEQTWKKRDEFIMDFKNYMENKL